MPKQITYHFGGRDRVLQADFRFTRILRDHGLSIRRLDEIIEALKKDEQTFPLVACALASTDEYQTTKAATGVGKELDLDDVLGWLDFNDVQAICDALVYLVTKATVPPTLGETPDGDPPTAQS